MPPQPESATAPAAQTKIESALQVEFFMMVPSPRNFDDGVGYLDTGELIARRAYRPVEPGALELARRGADAAERPAGGLPIDRDVDGDDVGGDEPRDDRLDDVVDDAVAVRIDEIIHASVVEAVTVDVHVQVV